MKSAKYTLITGASEGFGKSLAIECASHKMNLVLVALPGPQLHNLAKYIEKNYNVSVIALELDLRQEGNCEKLHEAISSQKICIQYMINNAGLLSRGYLADMETEYVLDQIKVNIIAPTILIKLFLKDLQQNAPSGILNVSSMASFFYLPQKQVYGATKSYLLSFSKSLRRELKRDHISVTTVCPGGINTSPKLIYQNRIGSWGSRKSIMEPEDVAKISIEAMLKRKDVVIPGMVNHFFMFLDLILPGFIKEMITDSYIKKASSHQELTQSPNKKTAPLYIKKQLKDGTYPFNVALQNNFQR